jgi:serine/threonine-protein kinase
MLGSTELRASSGRELRAVLAQPKRFALLAFLAMRPRAFHRRDTVVALFWPDLDSRRARGALSQALSFLRKELDSSSAAVIVTRGTEEIGINPAELWCDVAAFRDHIDSEHHGDALELYRGDLLDGFFADAGVEFDEWLSRERMEVRTSAAHAARRLAELREQEQNFTTAIAAARRAVDLSSIDERVLRELLGLLDRLGDRAGAIQAYDDFAARLAREYDAQPSVETAQFVDRIRSRDVARFVEPLTPSPGHEPTSGDSARANVRESLLPRHLTIASKRAGSTIVRRSPWLVGGAIAGITIVAMITRGIAERAEGVAVRFTVSVDSGSNLANVPGSMAISPDGRQIAISAKGPDGARRILVRSIGDLKSRVLPGTEGAEQLFFSPDGQWIGFYVRSLLKKIPTLGGSPVFIAEAPGMYGATWTPSGEIVVSTGDRLAVVAATGGPFRTLSRPDTAAHELKQLWPVLLSDGNTILYTVRQRYVEESRIGIARLDGGAARALDLPGTGALGVIEGQLVYSSVSGRMDRQALMAVPFDVRRGRLLGAPYPIAAGVRPMAWGAAAASLSRNGSLVYLFTDDVRRQVVLAEPRGTRRLLPGGEHAYYHPRFSPDGNHLAVSAMGEGLFVFDLVSGTITRLTNHRAVSPEWTPDGKRVIYLRGCESGQAMCEFWSAPLDLSGPETPFLRRRQPEVADVSLTRDGQTLVARVNLPSGERDIWFRGQSRDTAFRPLVPMPGNQFGPRISPDGRWIAFWNDVGPGEVFVAPLPGPGPRHQVSVDGGAMPVWSSDGRRLFFLSGTKLVSATLRLAPTFGVTRRDTLFEGDFDNRGDYRAMYDASPNGEQFALLVRRDREPQIIVVHDWKHEVRALRRGARP